MEEILIEKVRLHEVLYNNRSTNYSLFKLMSWTHCLVLILSATTSKPHAFSKSSSNSEDEDEELFIWFIITLSIGPKLLNLRRTLNEREMAFGS